MIFKCPLCFERHWTKSGRDKCHRKHVHLSLRACTNNGFGRAPDLPPISYRAPEFEREPARTNALDTLSNVALGYVVGDMIGSASTSSPAESVTAVEPAKPEPVVDTYTAPKDDYYRSSDSASSLSESSSSGGYSSLDSFSSLDSSSSDSSSSSWD